MTTVAFPMCRLLRGRHLLVAAVVLLGLSNAGFVAATHWWSDDSIPVSVPIAPGQRIDVIVWLRVPNMYGRYDEAHIHRLPGPLTITIHVSAGGRGDHARCGGAMAAALAAPGPGRYDGLRCARALLPMARQAVMIALAGAKELGRAHR